MLRGFLLDQFELKTHPETREVTVCALTLAGGKPKMTRADDSALRLQTRCKRPEAGGEHGSHDFV